jgi:diguanylate cyclase (GGDEF)-like protein
MRGYDIAGRFGGEEFVVLFPHTEADQARQIVERLRRQIAESAIPLDGSTNVAPLRITVSIGIAVAGQAGRSSLDELLAAADHALYQAKSSGRNRVVMFEDPAAHAYQEPVPARVP